MMAPEDARECSRNIHLHIIGTPEIGFGLEENNSVVVEWAEKVKKHVEHQKFSLPWSVGSDD